MRHGPEVGIPSFGSALFGPLTDDPYLSTIWTSFPSVKRGIPIISNPSQTRVRPPMTVENVYDIADSGESAQVEFKRTTGTLPAAAKTVCGMLHGEGSYILIGVRDGLVLARASTGKPPERALRRGPGRHAGSPRRRGPCGWGEGRACDFADRGARRVPAIAWPLTEEVTRDPSNLSLERT
mgnify:CR=1 FL=1